MMLVEKYANHQPLNRQSEQYAREGIDLAVSTMADHVGACAAMFMPLYELIKAHVFAAERIHGDDTTVPVLAKVMTRTGRIWTYVRDERPFGGDAPPAAVFFYSPDRSSIHPEQHLAGYSGILQADAYAGFNRLYEGSRKPGPLIEAACWSHARRKLFELADIAAKARNRIRRRSRQLLLRRFRSSTPSSCWNARSMACRPHRAGHAPQRHCAAGERSRRLDETRAGQALCMMTASAAASDASRHIALTCKCIDFPK